MNNETASHAPRSEVQRLSSTEITQKFSKELKRSAALALRISYNHTVDSFNLGLPAPIYAWEDGKNELRSQFGVNFESALGNILGAEKLPKSSHLDFRWDNVIFDVKVRTSEESKTVALNRVQNDSLVLIVLYNIKNFTYELYMGYPNRSGSTGPGADGKYSICRGKIRGMLKITEGTF